MYLLYLAKIVKMSAARFGPGSASAPYEIEMRCSITGGVTIVRRETDFSLYFPDKRLNGPHYLSNPQAVKVRAAQSFRVYKNKHCAAVAVAATPRQY